MAWAWPTRWTAVLILAFAAADVADSGLSGLFERLDPGPEDAQSFLLAGIAVADPAFISPSVRLCPPGSNHCLHGIPSGWSHDAPFAVRRPAHRPRHALASGRSRGRCHVRAHPSPTRTARTALLHDKHGQRPGTAVRSGWRLLGLTCWGRAYRALCTPARECLRVRWMHPIAGGADAERR
jgi:hypothetical protein